jgi:hypothetical protein
MSHFPSEILSSQRIQSLSKESLRKPDDAHPPRVNPLSKRISKSRRAVGRSIERQTLARDEANSGVSTRLIGRPEGELLYTLRAGDTLRSLE